MQQPIDGERVKITRIQLLLLLEDAGGQAHGIQWERLKLSCGMFRSFRIQSFGEGGLTDKRKAGGAGAWS